jgi:hypothetical protein
VSLEGAAVGFYMGVAIVMLAGVLWLLFGPTVIMLHHTMPVTFWVSVGTVALCTLMGARS